MEISPGNLEKYTRSISYLVESHEHQDGNDIHEGGVELEGDLGGADVIAGGHDALHDQSQAHRIVQAVLPGNSETGAINLLRYWQFCSQLFLKRFISFLSYLNNQHEDEAEDTVTKVAENVIEITQPSKASSTELIVVADILVSGYFLLVA